MKPYYEDGSVTLYCGSMFAVLPELGQNFDVCITDPPFGQTPLAWDSWQEGWPAVVAAYTSSLWCFGTMRMYIDRLSEFEGWKFAQDVVWTKGRATSAVTDRFRRQHELMLHFYRGEWSQIHHELPKVPSGRASLQTSARGRYKADTPTSTLGFGSGRWDDDGTRYMTTLIEATQIPSTLRAKNALNPTQKPEGVLKPLIQYGCPVGGVVLDPFAGSGTTGITARILGRRAVLIESREDQCEATAGRLAQQGFIFEGSE